MKIQEARELGDRITIVIHEKNYKLAYNLLAPVLEARTAFRMLDEIGKRLGQTNYAEIQAFAEEIASHRTMGGWVVIASALGQHLDKHMPEALESSRKYVIQANTWYATDIFGERVPGPALVAYFETALPLLEAWREDDNRWIRRMVGVAVHYWAKGAHGNLQYLPQAAALLDFLAPMFSEHDIDAAKGVGWGLKTLAKYYPSLVTDWLIQQTKRPHKKLILNKALTYLPPELRCKVVGNLP